jgi:hypothetical protein
MMVFLLNAKAAPGAPCAASRPSNPYAQQKGKRRKENDEGVSNFFFLRSDEEIRRRGAEV